MKAKTISLLIVGIFMAISAKANPTFKILDGISNNNIKSTMERNVNDLIAFINQSAVDKKKKINMSTVTYITPRVRETLEKMWESSMMTFPDADIKSSCLRVGSTGYQVRGIPIDVMSADKDEERQELTIDFTTAGQISNVALAIDIHRYDAIMKKTESDVDYARKQVVVNFVEDFRTAYNKKDLQLIESVFSSDALIITGRVIQRAEPKDLAKNKLSSHVDVEYDVLNKKQYIDKLRRIFKNNKFINVKFSDVTVVRVPSRKSDVYGVFLKQDWHTSRYHDEGMLYLKITFEDKDFPLIQVRVWKPIRDGSGNIIISDPKEDFAKFLMDYEI